MTTDKIVSVFLPPVSTSVAGNHHWGGQTYHLSWDGGVHNLTWDSARQYCDNLGMRLVTLDNDNIRQHFFTEVLYSY